MGQFKRFEISGISLVCIYVDDQYSDTYFLLLQFSLYNIILYYKTHTYFILFTVGAQL